MDGAAYERALEIAIRTSFERGAKSVGDVAASIGEADPVLIADVLRRLGLLNAAEYSRPRSTVARSSHRIDLPIPHPLDFDWRLCEESIRQVATLIADRSRGGRPLLVGVPTVFRDFVERGTPSVGATLYDRSGTTVASFAQALRPTFEAFRADARYDVPEAATHTAAFLDPPWYPDETLAFLRFASIGCVIGSTILLSAPGLLTRPGIDRERQRILGELEALGLELREIREGMLQYDSPPFERRAFQRAGISIPDNWRRGALFVLEKVSDLRMRPHATAADHELWEETTYAGVRFRVRLGDAAPQNGDLTFQPAIDGGVMPSVSSRDPRRARVDVWTSGNGVYVTSSPTKVWCILRALAAGESPHDFVERFVGRRLSAQEIEQVEVIRNQILAITAAEEGLYP